MIFFYISLSTYLCFLFLKLHKSLLVLNKEKFNLKKYHKWIINKENFINLELLGLIIIIIAFNADAKITGICMVILYTILYLYLFKDKQKKLTINKKIVSTIIICSLIYLGIFTIFLVDYLSLQKEFFLFDNSKYYYTVTILIGYFANYIVLLSAFITNIFTKIFKNHHKKN